MEYLALIIAITAIAVVSTKSSQIKYLEEDIKLLKKRTRDLHERLLKLTDTGGLTVEPSTEKESISQPSGTDIKPALEKSKADVVKEKVKKAKNKSKTLLLNKFIEEWSGAIGVISLVMGLAFLGIYSAAVIITEPFHRFLIFVTYSILILGGSIFLSRKERWRIVSLWLKSASGAVFLFLCIASSASNIKLYWIDNSIAGLFLLLAGVAFNLSLGYFSKKEIVASIHVFLSLLAIAIAPSTPLTLIVATCVSLYGLYLTYKEKWDLNFIIIMSLFFLYHLNWVSGLNSSNIYQDFTGLMSVTLIFFCCLFSHYRKIYSVNKFEKLPFFTHFLNWIFFAVGIYIYINIIPLKIVLLFSGSILALFIAGKAKKLNVRWLYVTDTLFANLLMIIGIVSLYNRGVNSFYVASILFAEAILFLIVMIHEKEILLSKIGYILTLVLGVTLFGLNIGYHITSGNEYVLNRMVTTLALLIPVSVLYLIALKRNSFFNSIDNKLLKLFSVIIGLLIYSVFIQSLNNLWSPYLLSLLVIPLIIYREKMSNNLLYFVLCSILTIVLLHSWYRSSDMRPLEAYVYNFSQVLIALLLIKFSNIGKSGKVYLWPLTLVQLHILVSIFNIFNPVSIYLPGILWLLVSVLYLEMSGSITKLKLRDYQKQLPDFVTGFGFVYLAVFFMNYLFNTVHSEDVIVGIKVRYFIEAFAFLILIYWATRKKEYITLEKKTLYKFKSLMIEVLYVYLIFTVFWEVRNLWQPVVWISFSLASLLIKRNELERMKFYSIFLAWMSAIHLSLITSIVEDGTVAFLREKWITGSLTIVLYVVYLVLIRSRIKQRVLEFPVFMINLKKLSIKIFRHINQWIYYPFFICVALFILFTFNKNVITLLFVFESLMIFILSMLLKEDNFKLISMLGILGSMIRLLFFDLRNSNTITRPLVFIGVGLVLVLMNIIYMKFKEKTQNE